MQDEDLSGFFQPPLAETATIAGVAVLGHFDLDAIDLFGGQFSGTGPTFECPASAIAAVAPGATAVVRGVTYKVRAPIRRPGDGAIAYLHLERQ